MYAEGLRIESTVQRVNLSRTIKEMVDYVEQHSKQDPLVVGIDKKSNHFIEKSSCSVL
jgi:guanine nucleotide-binding protein G(I)/G(S)/G(O) subunit gamma-7